MSPRRLITRPRALALSLALLLGVGGVAAGHELYARYAAPTSQPAPAADQPSAEDRQAWAALTTLTVEQPLTGRQEALRINASLPYSQAPLEAARPFVLNAGPDHAAALECLTAAVYYEAGFEPDAGQRAVAQVVLNRLRHPAFPKTVCGVVYQGAPEPGCQFSFACDGSASRAPAAGAWRRARSVAAEALRGNVMAEVGQATHYHTDWVAPYWAPRLAKVKQIGAHIFYRWPGSWGRRAAFTGRYAGGERPFEPAAATHASAPEPVVEGPPERRAPNDLGGRVTPGLGWTPSVPLPSQAGAMAKIMADQRGDLSTAAAPAAEG